ncbi:MAG: hypothetical protein ABUL41_03345, partial [Chitinophagaceae bacterium]
LKYISPLNIIVILIASFFLVIDLFNPGFQDDLWPYAAIGIIIAIGSVLIGISLILLRIFRLLAINDFYLSVGLLNFCFGLSSIIIAIIQQVPGAFFIAFSPLYISLVVFTEIFLIKRK